MEVNRLTRRFTKVSMDITSRCNARCKFCYNTFGQKEDMEMDLYGKMLQVLPYTKNSGFFLSGQYEPTLHPQFYRIAQLIPQQFRNKGSLTTNLCKPFTDEELNDLARCHLHHINISLETYDPALYTALTGVEEVHFYENLARLRSVFSRYAHPPRLQLVTMVLKSNYDELLELAERAHNEILPYRHIFRTPYIYAPGQNILDAGEKDTTAVEEELVSAAQLEELTARLQELGYGGIVTEFDLCRENYAEGRRTPPYSADPYAIHIFPDGSGVFLSDGARLDVKDMEYPIVSFSHMLAIRQEGQVQRYKLAEPLPVENHDEDEALEFSIDKITIWDERFLSISGWALRTDAPGAAVNLMLRVADVNSVHNTMIVQRPDVAMMFGSEAFAGCGFETLVDAHAIECVRGQPLQLHVGVQKDGVLHTKYVTDLIF